MDELYTETQRAFGVFLTNLPPKSLLADTYKTRNKTALGKLSKFIDENKRKQTEWISSEGIMSAVGNIVGDE